MSLHLEPGQRCYLGYHEWAVHPDEARVILARGYVLINGHRFEAQQVDLIAGRYPLIRVWGIDGDASNPLCPGLPEPLAVAA